MPRALTAVALIAAYNEADIIGPVIEHLIEQGVSVHLLDHGSTDGTAEIAGRFLGRGVLAVEPFPGDRFPAARDRFAWTDILTRKMELAATLDADWFIHHDADEFRESPWDGLTLREAIERVDRLGYNAIDFELFNFWPTGDAWQPGDDPRAHFRFYEPGRERDKPQVKAWKKVPARAGGSGADLVPSAGHDVAFDGRRVCPVRFLLRHYPVRSQAHGERKVFTDRRPRFVQDELRRGWHAQYDDFVDGQRFVRAPETLLEYDAETVRFSTMLATRDAEARQADLDEAVATVDSLRQALAARHEELRALDATRVAETGRLTGELRDALALSHRLVSDTEAQQREIAALRASKSWRLTAPLRAVQRWFTGPRV